MSTELAPILSAGEDGPLALSFWFQASNTPGNAFSYLFSTADVLSNDTFVADQLQLYLPQANLLLERLCGRCSARCPCVCG